jgi:hypothetical protein
MPSSPIGHDLNMLRIIIALKNSSPLAGFEPANLGSNGKHAEHYTTENDLKWAGSSAFLLRL